MELRIVIIHGQQRKIGSNYNLAINLAKKFNTNLIDEYFVNDIPYCLGCSNCIVKDENICPHKDTISPIAKKIDDCDLIIVNSPTYCMEMTGQLKAFFDHFAYRFILHRPHKTMRNKQAVVISTAAGGGSKRTAKSLANQMFWWGVGKTYRLNASVYASRWSEIKPSIKETLDTKSKVIAIKIMKKHGKIKQSLKAKLYHIVFKMLVKKLNNEVDVNHWRSNGWI